MTPAPEVSVIIATFWGEETVGRAAASVLEQHRPEVELVVVDATPGGPPPAVLALQGHPRVTVLHRPNRGMPANRNEGLAVARGRWIGFLDDDDALRPGWAATLLGAAGPETLVVAGAVHGEWAGGGPPVDEPPGRIGVGASSFVAGSFIVRADVLREVGGMLEGLSSGHHWELAVRLGDRCDGLPGAYATVDEPVVDLSLRASADRPFLAPREHRDGHRWLLARHARALAPHPRVRATMAALVGVATVRLGLVAEGRRWLVRAALDARRDPRAWARAAAVCLPPLRRRAWPARTTPGTTAPRRGAISPGLAAVGPLVEARGPTPDLLVLPWGYRERDEPAPAPGPGDLPRDVRQAVDRAVRAAARPVVVDADLHLWLPALTAADGWEAAGPVATAGTRHEDVLVAPLVLSSVADPHRALRALAGAMGPRAQLHVVERDRDAHDGPLHLGPPGAAAARRRWTAEELALVVEASGLAVVATDPPLPRLRSRRAPVATVVAASLDAGPSLGAADGGRAVEMGS